MKLGKGPRVDESRLLGLGAGPIGLLGAGLRSCKKREATENEYVPRRNRVCKGGLISRTGAPRCSGKLRKDSLVPRAPWVGTTRPAVSAPNLPNGRRIDLVLGNLHHWTDRRHLSAVIHQIAGNSDRFAAVFHNPHRRHMTPREGDVPSVHDHPPLTFGIERH